MVTVPHHPDGWESPHEPTGRLTPLVHEGAWVGWALGWMNAARAESFLKSDSDMQTIWPSWEVITARQTFRADFLPPGRTSLWPGLIYQPITQPSIRDLAKGASGFGDDAGAED